MWVRSGVFHCYCQIFVFCYDPSHYIICIHGHIMPCIENNNKTKNYFFKIFLTFNYYICVLTKHKHQYSGTNRYMCVVSIQKQKTNEDKYSKLKQYTKALQNYSKNLFESRGHPNVNYNRPLCSWYVQLSKLLIGSSSV